jgi:hypothetical protein
MPFLRDPFLVPPFLVPAIGQGAKEAGSGTLQPPHGSTDPTLRAPRGLDPKRMGCDPAQVPQVHDKRKTGCSSPILIRASLLWCVAAGDRNDSQDARERPSGSLPARSLPQTPAMQASSIVTAVRGQRDV